MHDLDTIKIKMLKVLPGGLRDTAQMRVFLKSGGKTFKYTSLEGAMTILHHAWSASLIPHHGKESAVLNMAPDWLGQEGGLQPIQRRAVIFGTKSYRPLFEVYRKELEAWGFHVDYLYRPDAVLALPPITVSLLGTYGVPPTGSWRTLEAGHWWVPMGLVDIVSVIEVDAQTSRLICKMPLWLAEERLLA